jgi:(p)ppGpp synthase/HD superfamily hydrolase
MVIKMTDKKRNLQRLLTKAIRIAAVVSEKVLDKGGNPYILHPLRIMFRLRTDDPELMMIAILHDVVEDSDWTIEDLRKEGFTERVLKALTLLTHTEGVSYSDYIERIATNIDAILVKMEDLRDNSDITRLKGVTQKDLLRTEKYHRSFVSLKEARKKFAC